MDGPRYQFVLQKGAERYIVRFRPGCRGDAICQLMEWAEDPELDFDWFDAAVMTRLIALRAAETGKQYQT